ncbi:unnamed protein product [Lampetra planeri]
MSASELWIVCAPGEPGAPQAWEKLQAATERVGLSENHKFHIPELKVGTLDSLVSMSDDLVKLDTFVEGVVRKITQNMVDVLEDARDKARENLVANGADPMTYVTKFQWDMARYSVRQPLQAVSDVIAKQVSQIDSDLKSRASAYNALKSGLQIIERRATGSLMTRSLSDIVKKDDFVLDSEYLITLLVIVPKPNIGDWNKCYETLSEMVVPRSSRIVFEDPEGYMCTVTLLQKAVEDFKLEARRNKFMVREFQYNEEALKADKEEINRLITDKKKQFGPMVRWLQVNFSEAFVAWIHLKALRVFVESVLRYGLPVNFQAALLKPRKNQKRLREVLQQLYKHLDSGAGISVDASMDLPGMSFNSQDYYPYVHFRLDLNLLESK